MRRWAVWMHRWVGLALVLPLLLVGLTGSLLSWNRPLQHLFAPELFANPDKGAAMAAGELAARLERAMPGVTVSSVYIEDGQSAFLGVNGTAPGNQAVVDAASGRLRGWQRVGGWPQQLSEVMPFVYRFHYSLAAGDTGHLVLGIFAVLWTVDSLVALWLTFPPQRELRRWPGRWAAAFRIRRNRGNWRLNFDIHRAGGLWLWLLLLGFAWSSVGFNLRDEVFRPVMTTAFAFGPLEVPPGKAGAGTPLGWNAVQRQVDGRLHELLASGVIAQARPIALFRDPANHRIEVLLHTDRDIGEHGGDTWLYLDDRTGATLRLHLATGDHAGDTLATWLANLHEANVLGLGWRVTVFLLGLALPVLGWTGLVIWQRKRQGRQRTRMRRPHLQEGNARSI